MASDAEKAPLSPLTPTPPSEPRRDSPDAKDPRPGLYADPAPLPSPFRDTLEQANGRQAYHLEFQPRSCETSCLPELGAQDDDDGPHRQVVCDECGERIDTFEDVHQLHGLRDKLQALGAARELTEEEKRELSHGLPRNHNGFVGLLYEARCYVHCAKPNSGVRKLLVKTEQCVCARNLVALPFLYLCDRGLSALLPLLRLMKYLQRLDLRGTGMTHHSAKLLVRCCLGQCTDQDLQVFGQPKDSEREAGRRPLPNLGFVDLSDNALGSKCFPPLLSWLVLSPQLMHLHVERTGLPRDQRALLSVECYKHRIDNPQAALMLHNKMVGLFGTELPDREGDQVAKGFAHWVDVSQTVATAPLLSSAPNQWAPKGTPGKRLACVGGFAPADLPREAEDEEPDDRPSTAPDPPRPKEAAGQKAWLRARSMAGGGRARPTAVAAAPAPSYRASPPEQQLIFEAAASALASLGRADPDEHILAVLASGSAARGGAPLTLDELAKSGGFDLGHHLKRVGAPPEERAKVLWAAHANKRLQFEKRRCAASFLEEKLKMTLSRAVKEPGEVQASAALAQAAEAGAALARAEEELPVTPAAE